MKITRWTLALVVAFVLFAAPSWGRVLLRWTQPAVPAREVLGLDSLVIPGGPNEAVVAARARQLGYRVYLEVPLPRGSAISDTVAAQGVSGIILEPGEATQVQAEAAAAKMRLSHPGLLVLVVDRTAKEPQMRGHSIVSNDGVLEASSPTEQPWLDCNLALVRYDAILHPAQVPLYQFDWELPEPLQRREGPSAGAYALAAAEAGAFHADVILNVREDLQTRLAQGEAGALAFWARVRPYLQFAQSSPAKLQPQADIGVVADSGYDWFEPANLMARHNIPFRILTPAELSGGALHGLNLLVTFAAPDHDAVAAVAKFASRGGTAVLVNAKGMYPWHSARPIRSNEAVADYAVGKGKVIELLKAVDDPDTFASDIRRLMDKSVPLISLWNALTTIAVPYQKPSSADLVVELVNYAQDALPVQVRVKGTFSSIRYESPEDGCCRKLQARPEKGSTEFVVPRLATAGRVYLSAGPDEKHQGTTVPSP